MKMDGNRIQMLLVEDDGDDAVIIQHFIDSIDTYHIDLDWEPAFEIALEKIVRNNHDLCMIDFRLGAKNGIDLMRRMKRNRMNIPMIILTGKGDRRIDMEAMRFGAADFLEKASLTSELLERSIRYTIERNRTLSELRNARERLRMLSIKLIDAQERERRLIAQELHDSIGSGMTAIKFALEAKIESMDKDNLPSSGISVEQILSMVQETVEETRRIGAKLRPSILDDLGLVQTIGWLCRNFQTLHPNIRIRQSVDIKESDVPESLKTVVYRILQETLNNVAKHSGADLVDLLLGIQNGYLELKVRDNGKGFNKKDAIFRVRSTGGMGLEGMQNRVELTNGKFEVDSWIGEGTTVWATLPIFPPDLFQ